jgi:hypothetical protein
VSHLSDTRQTDLVNGFPRAEQIKFLVERASECFALARFLPSAEDEGDEYLDAAARLANQPSIEQVNRFIDELDEFLARRASEAPTEPPAKQPDPPQPEQPPHRRRQRKPSIATLVKRAEKTGKAVTSITTPDGTTINFSQEPGEANNPWLDDLKVTKQ